MVAKETPIQDVMKVVLNTAATELDEVMVVAYGTAKKSSFTGSAKAVNAEDIVAGSKESLDKALSGKMSGVRVTSNTGDPGYHYPWCRLYQRSQVSSICRGWRACKIRLGYGILRETVQFAKLLEP